jgi:ankyrin repeat protein
MMFQPDELKSDAPLQWSPETGAEVWTMLSACAAGDLPAVQRLVAANPSLVRCHYVYRTPIIGAKTRELTELLFAHGMNPSARDWLAITPLHYFAMRGDLANAALFIDRGADLHARDEDLSSTPLGWAAKGGKVEMVEFLLSRGAKPRLPDDPPWATPMAWAIRGGHQDVVDGLRDPSATR